MLISSPGLSAFQVAKSTNPTRRRDLDIESWTAGDLSMSSLKRVQPAWPSYRAGSSAL